MKHSLITGGAGFIGSHLAEHLLNLGEKVTIIDDLSTGSIHNIEHLKQFPQFKYVVDSCQNKSLVAELVDDVHEIYHLAAAVGVKLIVADSAKTIHLNYTLTEIVLEMAAKKNKPILFTSTSEVYGKSPAHPYREDGDLLLGSSTKWRWAYACSKLLDEFMILSAYSTKNVPAVIIRLFNTVGPRQTGQYGMVIPNFVQQALQHKPISVYGDGSQSRCFCHVKDVVPEFPTLLRNKNAHGEIFNIGSTEEITILNLAKTIKQTLNSKSEIEMIPYEKAYNKGFEDMQRRVPCIEKVHKTTGFMPSKNIRQIIQDVSDSIHSDSNTLS